LFLNTEESVYVTFVFHMAISDCVLDVVLKTKTRASFRTLAYCCFI